MQTNPHHLYILKDCTPETAGRGAVIGFLKVGYKKLFVLDHKGSHVEAEPLCILDFYVHESLQRHGFGKELFTSMLRNEHVEPQHLAIDRPSEKFLSFLKKHYNLRSTIPQVNNFVVFEGFFRDHRAHAADVTLFREVEDLPANWTEALERWKEQSERDRVLKHEEGLPWPFNQSQATLNRAGSLGSSPTRSSFRHAPSEEDFVKSLRSGRPHSLHRAANGEQEDPSQRRRTSEMNSSRGLMAQRSCYSRHTAHSPPLFTRGPDIKETEPVTVNGSKRNTPEDALNVTSHSQNQQETSKMPSEPRTGVILVGAQKEEGQSKCSPQGVSKYPWGDQYSWTVLGNVNAQWVKRKQEFRGTRPW
ncbi:alpha-tubulin N-acetyltransferase 1 isoform 2-T2 [Discoglossus pictus]